MSVQQNDLPEGVTLQRSSLGGFSIYVGAKFVGWIHESGNQWNAYLRQPHGEPGLPLGKFSHKEAVRRVALEAGWPGQANSRW